MNQVLEKEVRGALNKDKALEIEEYANVHNWKKHSYKQISIYCNTDHIDTLGSVNDGKGRLIIDIRDNSIKIKIKLGNAVSFERKEYLIKCSKDSCESLAVLFHVLGVNEGYIRTFDRTDYVTEEGIQLTVKLNCLMGDHFELERNCDDKNIVNSYNIIIDDLNLLLWTKDELAKAIQNDHDKVKAEEIYSYLRRIL